jgi:zinc transport system ATP-binding protein
MNDTLVAISNLNAGYDDNIVLHNVNLDIKRNDFIGIIGPNGGGKTTFLKVLTGELKPKSGKVDFFLNGASTEQMSIGYMSQKSLIDPRFPIEAGQVVMSGLIDGSKTIFRPNAQTRQKVMEVMSRMGIELFYNRPVSRLSGGEFQKVLLARAVVSDPQILLLDEPDTYLDATAQNEFYRYLGILNQEMAIVLVSHDIGMISPLVKSIACINRALHYHPGNKISEQILGVYSCPVELVTHGSVPHRVLKSHQK